jgi:selenoprotein W-related protein
MAQELLTTFAKDMKGVLLQPSETSSRYIIFIDDMVFDRNEPGRFLKIKTLK